MKLAGRTALVTGGSRGIGRAIALGLAAEGADVAVNYISNVTKADEVVTAIRAMGRKAVSVGGDVSLMLAAKDMVAEAIATLGHIDILVNNAGVTSDKSFVKMDVEAWHRRIGRVEPCACDRSLRAASSRPAGRYDPSPGTRSSSSVGGCDRVLPATVR